MTKKVILAAAYSPIEPLAPMHLSSVARQEGWEPRIVLGREPDFPEIKAAIESDKPDLLGFSVFTGNHPKIFAFLNRIKAEHPHLGVVVGGPHITVFPQKVLEHADYAVLSEGFDAFRRILRGQARQGIVPVEKLEHIPPADRAQFYRDYPEHAASKVKSVITQTGCPHSCNYCYNSVGTDSLASILTGEQMGRMKEALGKTGRLFPRSVRTVEEVVAEIEDIQRLAPETLMIFFQDDSFGANIGWLREFREKYKGVPFHLMTRFEFVDPSNPTGRERGRLLKEAGCSGLTFAIESADPEIREDVLNRHMSEDDQLMFRTLEYCRDLGFGVRTFSILGIPYGATETPTEINLEQDLKTLDLNVRLKEKTGLPTIAWASTLVPYAETKIDRYCKEHGHYIGDYDDIHKIGFRDESVLRFPRKWVGPGLNGETPDAWLSPSENSNYRRQLKTLMAGFPLFALLPNGQEVAREILEREKPSWNLYEFALTPEVLRNIPRSEKFAEALRKEGKCDEGKVNDITRKHLYNYELYKIEK